MIAETVHFFAVFALFAGSVFWRGLFGRTYRALYNIFEREMLTSPDRDDLFVETESMTKGSSEGAACKASA